MAPDALEGLDVLDGSDYGSDVDSTVEDDLDQKIEDEAFRLSILPFRYLSQLKKVENFMIFFFELGSSIPCTYLKL